MNRDQKGFCDILGRTFLRFNWEGWGKEKAAQSTKEKEALDGGSKDDDDSDTTRVFLIMANGPC